MWTVIGVAGWGALGLGPNVYIFHTLKINEIMPFGKLFKGRPWYNMVGLKPCEMPRPLALTGITVHTKTLYIIYMKPQNKKKNVCIIMLAFGWKCAVAVGDVLFRAEKEKQQVKIEVEQLKEQLENVGKAKVRKCRQIT